jgi:probable HAF family extracellular repeat protein
MTDLGTLGGRPFNIATGINDSGQVVGYSYTAASDFHAFFTGPNGTGMTDLGTLGGQTSQAFDINDSGEVTGLAEISPGGYHAFLYSHGGITDLSLLNRPGISGDKMI